MIRKINGIRNFLLEPKEIINYEIKKFYDMIRVKETRVVKGFFWEKLELGFKFGNTISLEF
jgi:hypothetical protein